ncbi:MAG: AMP-dependent synthetase/ligase [Planctomycetota bacterium]
MTELHHPSFSSLLRASATRFQDRIFLPRRHGRGGDPVTFAELRADVRRIAAGLRSLGFGHGDRIGLIAENRYEWILCDQAIVSFGGVDVPRGTDTAIGELLFILGHAGCRFAFVETPAVADALAAHRAELPDLEGVAVMTGSASDVEAGGALDLDALRARGDAWLATHSEQLDQDMAAVGPDDLLTIIYTSGTTANPKGVALTHGNVLSNLAMVGQVLEFDARDVALSILPAWHAYERIMDYVLLEAGGQLVYSDRRRIKEDLQSVRPTIFVAVPRIWEMLHDGIVAQCRKQTGFMRRLLEHVLQTCRRVGAGRAGLVDRMAHRLYERRILPRFLAALGGNLRLAVSGGGALPPHVDECLIGMGVPLLNGYGLTETSPVVSVRTPSDNCVGTIGRPIPGTTCEIRDENGAPVPPGEIGLIWIRGPQVMQGYYRNEEETRRILVDGWFNSGDLGRFGTDGQLRITGRAKDTIVLAGGENVEPERIETALKTSPLIEQAVVVGQDQKHLGALLVVHEEMLASELPRERWDVGDGVLRGADVQALYRRELDRLLGRSEGFRAIERVATFRVLAEPMSAENGLLTQTMKIKRHAVQQRYAALLAELHDRT